MYAAMTKVQKSRAWALFFLILILLGTLIAGPAKESVLAPFPSFLHADKLGHVAGFCGLGFWLVRTQIRYLGFPYVLAWACALGSTTELCQLFIPGRTGKITDVLIDMLGAFVGAWLARQMTAANCGPRQDC
jgi:glycopeptide antibiotics resistance protein